MTDEIAQKDTKTTTVFPKDRWGRARIKMIQECSLLFFAKKFRGFNFPKFFLFIFITLPRCFFSLIVFLLFLRQCVRNREFIEPKTRTFFDIQCETRHYFWRDLTHRSEQLARRNEYLWMDLKSLTNCCIGNDMIKLFPVASFMRLGEIYVETYK